MKDTPHTAESSLFADLSADPQRFEPVTALRLAQAEARRQGKPATIRASTQSALAPVAVARVADQTDEIAVEADLIGLTGPLSPLPPAYTELAARDKRRRAGGLAAFLDMFTDRLTWLFADAADAYDLPALLRWQSGRSNRIVTALRGLIGFATPTIHDHMPLEDDTTLRFAGLLAQRTRSAMGLETLASAQLGLPVKVEQFHTRWRSLPEAEQTQLNGTARLGIDATAGAQVPDRAGQCRLIVGPVRYSDFLSLEAGQPRLERLRRLARLYLGPVLDFDIQIILDRRDVPESRMSADATSARLGWNTWARSSPASRDSDEAVIEGGRADLMMEAT